MGYTYRGAYPNETCMAHSYRQPYPNEIIGIDRSSRSLSHWKYLRKYKGNSGDWVYVYDETKNDTAGRIGSKVQSIKDYDKDESNNVVAQAIKIQKYKKQYAAIASRMKKEAEFKIRQAEEEMKLEARISPNSNRYKEAKDRYDSAKEMLKYAEGYERKPGYLKYLDDYYFKNY